METESRMPPWSITDVVAVLVIVLAGSFGSSAVFNAAQISTAGRFLLAASVQAFLFTGTVALVALSRMGKNLSELLTPDLFTASAVGKGILGGLVLYMIVLFSGAAVTSLIPVRPEPQPFVGLLLAARTPFEVAVPFVVGGFLAPLGEEIYFRGFTYPVLRERFGVTGGIIVTAIFFALMHFDALRFVPLALGGAGLAWLYEKTGSLVTPIIAHAVWNTSMLGMLLLASKFAGFSF